MMCRKCGNNPCRCDEIIKELEFISSDDLYTAFVDRFDNVLVVVENDIDKSKAGSFIRWKGSPIMALGMAKYAEGLLIKTLNATLKETE